MFPKVAPSNHQLFGQRNKEVTGEGEEKILIQRIENNRIFLN
jgi:hypothetical protein